MLAIREIRDRRDFFELLQRVVVLACPRVNQRQIGNPVWTGERVLGNRHEFNCAPRLADRFFFSAKPSIKFRNVREVRCILGLVALLGFHFFARGCKHGLRLLLIAARTRNQSVSPTRRSTEGQFTSPPESRQSPDSPRRNLAGKGLS